MDSAYFILCSLTFTLGSSLPENCFKKNLFATKTAYKFVGNSNLSISIPSGHCKPIHINMVHRHGNRYPSSKDVRRIDEVFQLLKVVDNKTRSRFAAKNPYRKEQDKLLNVVGENELYDIGLRLVGRFPTLFADKYSPLKYKFHSTCKTRSLRSASALSLGVFKGKGSLNGSQPVAIESRPCNDDVILRFFDKCEKYKVDVDDNEASTLEQERFGKSHHMLQVINNVNKKLGLTTSKLDASMLKTIYILCAYELGTMNGNMSHGFCSLLNDTDLNVIEYYYDLKQFYKKSSGFPISYKISCPLLKDVVDSLKTARSSSDSLRLNAIFRSSHSETVLPLFTLLGVRESHKLTADNYSVYGKSRRFRSACLSPFAGNVYFVLYECTMGHSKIQMYVNERPVKIPGCTSAVDCEFEVFLLNYDKPCNFEEMCSMKSGALPLVNIYFIFTILLVTGKVLI